MILDQNLAPATLFSPTGERTGLTTRREHLATWLAPLGMLGGLGGLAACAGPAPVHKTVRRAEATSMTNLKERAAKFGLVSITDVDPSILIDMRYATPDNVTHEQLYPGGLPCFAALRTARKLARAQTLLKEKGLGLRIWDAWRPPESHLKIWQKASTGLYVSNPRAGWSKHCFGRAVDATLVTSDGLELSMPTYFDDFSPKAHFIYHGPNPEIGKRLVTMQRAMQRAGFTFIDTEWWHFNDAKDGERLTGEPVWGRDLGLKV
jgi:zinc D-Ala-D-Ala dipeptidase